jgi:precorrin-6B methylase 2
MNMLLILLLLLNLCLICGAIFIGIRTIWQLARAHMFNDPPYVPVSHKIVPAIVEALKLKDGDVLFDIGCGDGRVLKKAVNSNQTVRGVGIDYDRWVAFRARITCMKEIRSKKISIIRADAFDQDLSGATVVFTYLFPGFMDRLFVKLKKELKPGTRLVSCDFKFKDIEPIQTIDLQRPKHVLGRTLYVYQF